MLTGARRCRACPSRNAWLKLITFLPHAVLPRLVRHSLALVHLLVCRAHGVEHRLKGRSTSCGRQFRERASCHTADI
ncbi:hypothetical protein BGY98DRAFT_1027158 [Russula aff. rugulosa BPL654]|nr:hypothetical protein BGY98DRAFT_1027158 [Russula aff. rugulosa BPL654]